MRTLIVISVERLKRLSLHAEIPRPYFVRTVQFSIEVSIAIFIQKIMGECAKHHYSSHLIPYCLKSILVVVEVVIFALVEVDNICKCEQVTV